MVISNDCLKQFDVLSLRYQKNVGGMTYSISVGSFLSALGPCCYTLTLYTGNGNYTT